MAIRFDLTLIKRHPYIATGTIVVSGLVIYFLFLRGNGGAQGTAIVAGSPSQVDNAVQREAQAQNFQLQYLQAKQAGEFATTQLQAQTSTVQQVNAIQGQLAVEGQRISSQSEIEKLRIANEAFLEQSRSQYALQSQVVAQTGAYQLAQLTTQANIAINASNVSLQKSIAQYQTQALTTIAGYQAQTQQKSDTFGFITGIAGIASSFFSDRRLKSNVKRVGTHKLGIGIYEYDLVGVANRQRGLMADEVLIVRPDAVKAHETGLLMVDYAALAA